jgi:hypothetical protein
MMRSKRFGLGLTALMLSALTAGGTAQASIGSPALRIATCGEGGSTTLPLDRLPWGHKRDCPAGCHAFCDRKRPALQKRRAI